MNKPRLRVNLTTNWQRYREKIAVTPQLTFNGAKILELDGRQPADEILQASLRAIHAALS